MLHLFNTHIGAVRYVYYWCLSSRHTLYFLDCVTAVPLLRIIYNQHNNDYLAFPAMPDVSFLLSLDLAPLSSSDE